MSKIVAIANHKGGSAKTVTTWSIGALLAQRGLRVRRLPAFPHRGAR